MGIPVGLLISYVRSHHGISLRAAAKELKMPPSSLADVEDFVFVPSLELADHIWYFFRNHPVEPEHMLPKSPANVVDMLMADYAFRQMVPLLRGGYHDLDRPSPGKGGLLFFAIDQIYLDLSGREEEGLDFGFKAPADPIAKCLVRHLFAKKWGATEKRWASRVTFVPTSENDPLAAGFRGAPSAWHEILFPEKPGTKSYFAFQLLYILTKHMALRFPPVTIEWEKQHTQYVFATSLLNPMNAEKSERFPDIRKGLERMWYDNFGRSLFAPGDILILHGPEGDVTLFGESVSRADSFWVVLKGDWFSSSLGWRER